MRSRAVACGPGECKGPAYVMCDTLTGLPRLPTMLHAIRQGCMQYMSDACNSSGVHAIHQGCMHQCCMQYISVARNEYMSGACNTSVVHAMHELCMQYNKDACNA